MASGGYYNDDFVCLEHLTAALTLYVASGEQYTGDSVRLGHL